MRLFLDTSVLLAACDSPDGGSRVVIEAAPLNGWTLIVNSWVLGETDRNVHKLSSHALQEWQIIRPRLRRVRNVLAIPKPVVFQPTKDRPVLLTAHEFADVLLTLDRRDFRELLGANFYHLRILSPRDFLQWCRASGSVFLP